MTDLQLCTVVPTYDNPRTIRGVVERLREHLDHVIVVDDGSGPTARTVIDELAADGLADVVRREHNGGKGAAVKAGLRRAMDEGFTHAVQVDADGQHEIDDVPRFVAAARAHPEALVLGAPRFDHSAPRARLLARQLSIFWAHVESGSDAIRDPLCGYRVYPIRATLAAGAASDRMEFDPEIAVLLMWSGLPVVNVETHVRYLSAEEGGVSHFRVVRDYALISWMHTRLMVKKTLRRHR